MKSFKLTLLAAAVCCALTASAQQSQLAQAQEAYRQKKYDQAITLLRGELGRNPGSDQARYYLGMSLWESGKREEAYPELKNAHELNGKNGDYLYAFGVLCVELKKFTEAHTAFNAGLKLRENPSRFFYGRGLLFMACDSLDHATVALMKAREAKPDDAKIYRAIADAYARQKVMALAFDNYREALRLDPNWVEVHYTLGKLLQKEKQFNEALIEFKEVVRLDSNFVEAYFDLGNLYYAGKRYAEAATVLEHFIGLKSDYYPAYFLLAKSLYASRQIVSALPHAQKAVALNPKPEAQRLLATLYYDNRDYENTVNVYAGMTQPANGIELQAEDYVRWGRSYTKLKKYDDAIKQYQQAIALDSTLSDVYFDLGTLLVIQKRYAEAIPCFDKKIRSDSTATGAYFNKGIAYVGLADWQAAIPVLKNGLRYKPDHLDGRLSLARTYAQVDSFAQAEVEYEAVLKLDPKHSEAHKQVGYYNLLKKNYAKAVQHLRKHVELEPKSEYGWLWLAQGLALNRQFADAMPAYRRVLQLNPKNADAQKGLDMLEQFQ
jgi:tetratricopeptide (TPR) repeat protein